jgi:hypothetical protein
VSYHPRVIRQPATSPLPGSQGPPRHSYSWTSPAPTHDDSERMTQAPLDHLDGADTDLLRRVLEHAVHWLIDAEAASTPLPALTSGRRRRAAPRRSRMRPRTGPT